MGRAAELASIFASVIAITVGGLKLAEWKIKNKGRSIIEGLKDFVQPRQEEDPK